VKQWGKKTGAIIGEREEGGKEASKWEK